MSVTLGVTLALSLVVMTGARTWPTDARCLQGDTKGYTCHPDNPGIFIRCAKGRIFEFHCPSGLHFNTKTQNCDWPKNADCKRLNEVGSKTPPASAHPTAGPPAQDIWEKKSTGSPWWRPKNTKRPWWEKNKDIWQPEKPHYSGSGMKNNGGAAKKPPQPPPVIDGSKLFY